MIAVTENPVDLLLAAAFGLPVVAALVCMAVDRAHRCGCAWCRNRRAS